MITARRGVQPKHILVYTPGNEYAIGIHQLTASCGSIYAIYVPRSRYKPTNKAAAAAYYNDMLQIFQGLAAVTNSAPGNPHLIFTILT